MWFNHVIKIEDSEMFSADNLWKFVTRGAMILCSNNQRGIDIVLPLCHTKENLSPRSVTAILIQVKNAKEFGKEVKSTLFDAMGPFDLGVFRVAKEGALAEATPKPVIRLVFALASPEASVVFRGGATRKSRPNEFTAFDIWLAGLSADTFKQVGLDLEPYRTLLDRSVRPHDAFELLDEPLVGEATKKLRGSRRRRVAPLMLTDLDHDSIHRKARESAAD